MLKNIYENEKFKKVYENIGDIIYIYSCFNIIIFSICAIITVLFGIIISFDGDIDVVFFCIGIAIAVFLIGCVSSLTLFAISKLIKNGDRQFEQNKEIIKLLSERK